MFFFLNGRLCVCRLLVGSHPRFLFQLMPSLILLFEGLKHAYEAQNAAEDSDDDSEDDDKVKIFHILIFSISSLLTYSQSGLNDSIQTFLTKRLPPPWWTFCLVTSCYISHMLKQMYSLQYITLTNLCCAYKKKGRFYLPSNLFRFEKYFKSFLVPVDLVSVGN